MKITYDEMEKLGDYIRNINKISGNDSDHNYLTAESFLNDANVDFEIFTNYREGNSSKNCGICRYCKNGKVCKSVYSKDKKVALHGLCDYFEDKEIKSNLK